MNHFFVAFLTKFYAFFAVNYHHDVSVYAPSDFICNVVVLCVLCVLIVLCVWFVWGMIKWVYKHIIRQCLVSSASLYAQELMECRDDLMLLLSSLPNSSSSSSSNNSKGNYEPLLVRLAFTEALSYNQSTSYSSLTSLSSSNWPECGGCNGLLHYPQLYNLPFNQGLEQAIQWLQPLKTKYHRISWADLIQLAGCIAIEVCGGPSLQEKMRFGRVDAPYYYQQTEKEIDKEHAKDTKSMPISSSNNKKCPCYPSALPPYPDAAPTAEIHLRNVFYRLGCSNKDIVALMGAHTIGRAFANRSGVCSNTSGDRGATKYTCQTWDARGTGKDSNDHVGVGIAGGRSWTKHWLRFDNSYFSQHFSPESLSSNALKSQAVDNSRLRPIPHDSDLLWLPIDQALYDCPEFRPYFILFARDQEAFFNAYAVAHIKFSNLGCRWRWPDGLHIPALPKLRSKEC